MQRNLQQIIDCKVPGCPKSNIWQSLMILALCGMAVTLACMGVANENFREVMYVIVGAIAFIKVNWNQGQMMQKTDTAVEKAKTAATVAAETKKSLEAKIDEKAAEIQKTAIEARDTAGESVLVTVEGNKMLGLVHDNTNGAKARAIEEAYQKGRKDERQDSKF